MNVGLVPTFVSGHPLELFSSLELSGYKPQFFCMNFLMSKRNLRNSVLILLSPLEILRLLKELSNIKVEKVRFVVFSTIELKSIYLEFEPMFVIYHRRDIEDFYPTKVNISYVKSLDLPFQSGINPKSEKDLNVVIKQIKLLLK